MTTAKQEEPNFIVCTDLDGTLLDHHTYSWNAAKETLHMLRNRNIPVIINTSKTFEEVLALQTSMALEAPFIVENGSAIYIPKTQPIKTTHNLLDEGKFWLKILGREREDITHFCNSTRKHHGFKFQGYSDWQVEDIMQLTGLDYKSAALSYNRRYSEPLIWSDTDNQLQQFTNLLTQNNLRLLKGGRFYHVIGNSDKGTAMLWLQQFYGATIPVVCLGDSDNDIEMLNKADYPVLVKSPTREYPVLSNTASKHIVKTQGHGPVGWAEAIERLIPIICKEQY